MVGLVLAVWSVPLLARLAGPNAPAAGSIGLDPSALVFTLTVSLLTGIAYAEI